MTPAAPGVTTHPGSNTAGDKLDSIDPEVRTRIEGLLVDPSRVTPLDGISGNAPAKKKIKSAMFISTRAQHVEEVATRGTLLHGPSGTGKSLLAVAGAAFSGRFKVYRVKGSDLIAKWQGSSEQYIAAIFAIAEPNGPSAISVHVTEVRFWGTGKNVSYYQRAVDGNG